eukprot:6492126-Amphidinium_carterae.2
MLHTCLLFIPLEETGWALYAESESGARIPQGSQCDQCFHIWSRGFSYMTWSELVTLHERDEPFRVTFARAKQTHLSGVKLAEEQAQVEKVLQVGCEVRRSFVILNEREMRRETSQNRIKKSALKSLPSLMLPAEDGSGKQELVYLFADPTTPHRRLDLKVEVAGKKADLQLAAGEALWKGQGEQYYTHVTSTTLNALGMLSVLEKEASGHLSLPSWESFQEEKFGEKEEVEVEDDDENPLMEAKLQLVGPAALSSDHLSVGQPASSSAATHAALKTPPGQKKPNISPQDALKRLGSGMLGEPVPGGSIAGSVADNASVLDGGTEADALEGHIWKENAQTSMLIGRHKTWRNVPKTLCPISNATLIIPFLAWLGFFLHPCFGFVDDLSRGEDSIAYWKTRCSIEKIITGKLDLRALTGLTKAVHRRLAKESTYQEGALLNNYLKICTACKGLGPKMFAGCAQADLHSILEKLEAEGISLPLTLQHRVLNRRITNLTKERQYEEIVKVVNPWRAPSPFSWKEPKVADLMNETTVEKHQLFKQVLFTDVLAVMIGKGEEQSHMVVGLCKQCLQICNGVDVFSLELADSKIFAECETVWKAFVGLFEDSPDSSHVDHNNGQKKQRFERTQTQVESEIEVSTLR